MPASLLVNNVYFTLNDNSAVARAALLAAIRMYLTGHPGIVFFAAGVLEDSLQRPVNDRNFDVGLHISFASKADHDTYQVHPRHLQFIEENKPNWKQVRVFDSTAEQA